MFKLSSKIIPLIAALLILALSSCSSSESGQTPEVADEANNSSDSGQMPGSGDGGDNSGDPGQMQGGEDDGGGNSGDPDQMPDNEEGGGESVLPDPAPVVVSSRTPFELISRLPVDHAVFTDVRSVLPFAVSDEGTRVLIKASFFDDTDTFVRQFVSYDASINNATVLDFTPVTDSFPAFDMTWETMAYANGCDTTIQQRVLSEAISLNSVHGLNALCANQESAQISNDGETILMPSSRIDNGSSVPIIFGVSGGTLITLDKQFLQQADAALAGRISTAHDPDLSADGRYVVATVIVADDPVTVGQNINFSAGSIVVDTRTAESRVIGLSNYERFNCERCDILPVSAPVISGNGRYVVYEQAPEIQIPGEEPVSNTTLFRYDINTDETQQVRAGTRGTSEIVISDNGARVAWRVGADVQIAYVGSDEIISLQDGFKFCTDDPDDCLFATARFITNEAIEMSGDGSALIVYLIPQQDTGASAADRSELLHFDLDTGTLSRLAPGANEPFYALSHDGRTVALIALDEQGIETIAVLRAVGDGG